MTESQQLLDILMIAEKLFWERNKEWTFIWIEYKLNWPYIMYYPNKSVSIVLTPSTKDFHPQFIYQLSHEVCHLLYPTWEADANVLNEWISTYFSEYYEDLRYKKYDYAFKNIIKSPYYGAYLLFKKIFNLDKDIVKKIRKINPNISEITFKEIKKLWLNIEDDVLEQLIKKFSK